MNKAEYDQSLQLKAEIYDLRSHLEGQIRVRDNLLAQIAKAAGLKPDGEKGFAYEDVLDAVRSLKEQSGTRRKRTPRGKA
ncbi:MAG: hypothetical protein JJU10_05425 [Idiomarina sp.]|nr:hypothetical protein [Idiomarina sp.]